MKENKKVENVFTRKILFITLVVFAGIILISVVMNMIIPEEPDVIETSQIQSTKTSVQKDDGLTSVYSEDAVSVNSDAIPDASVPIVASENNTAPEENSAETEDLQKSNDPAADTLPSESTIMIAPISGSILKDYSDEDLQYSETMNDWRVHLGIDFSAPEGSDVYAATDGIVSQVIEDSMLGTCVVITHPDGLKTVYGNLQENSGVGQNAEVKAGDVIGKVGKTATLEILEEPHLHFEIIDGEENVNPHNYIDKTGASL